MLLIFILLALICIKITPRQPHAHGEKIPIGRPTRTNQRFGGNGKKAEVVRWYSR